MFRHGGSPDPGSPGRWGVGARAGHWSVVRSTSHKIGTITAYCERVSDNKCPDAVNQT
ncbi:hypothetical protein Sxan_25520 [Streptomyces xanthophaeus]|uniref:Uncharacterized protein n=1 Tax=Streptomyces xanthophaeus TaxID=67385 RepID=A0A919LA44_9ACTN|nr:hypothetical protein Sxan_25520 [Streptomyces xanthophaeus]